MDTSIIIELGVDDFKAPSPLYEQEVVNSSFQVEKLFSHPYPWERWFINAIENGTHRRFKPVAPNFTAIREACNMVGLRNVPELYHDDQFGFGCTVRVPYSPALVMFDHFVSPIAASVILWHELRHAAQHEREGYMPMTQPMPNFFYNPSGYWYHPDEVDARSFEKYGIDFPLVVEAYDYVPRKFPWGSPWF